MASVHDAGLASLKTSLLVCGVATGFIIGLPNLNAALQGALGTPWPQPHPWWSAAALLGPAILAYFVWQIVSRWVDALPERRAFGIAHRLHWVVLAVAAVGMSLVIALA